MSNLFEFFFRYKNTLLFLFLFFISLGFTFQAHSYQKSKFISSVNFVSGGLYSWRDQLYSYFQLRKENKLLTAENKRLQTLIFNQLESDTDAAITDTVFDEQQYQLFKGRIIANRYADVDNYLLVNKGYKDSIKPEYGVMTDKGVVGIVEAVSKNYARVISILNTNLSISAQLKKTDHFGTLIWEGKNPNRMSLTDIPRTAQVKKGDTIMTNGRSFIFPKGILIGTVDKVNLKEGQNYYDIRVKLFDDMTNLSNVYIIRNKQKPELDSLSRGHE